MRQHERVTAARSNPAVPPGAPANGDGLLTLHHGASLRALNTFGVEATTAVLAEVRAAAALPELFDAIGAQGLPWLALGEGSNVLLVGDYAGIVVRPLLRGIEIVEDAREHALVRTGAGENWHALVRWTLDRGLYGLENLALIPGSVGAAPVQNIGAYGVELDRFVEAVEAFDSRSGTFATLRRDDCGFSYRDSRFKRERDRWLITALTLRLPKTPAPVLDYAGVREQLSAMAVADPGPRDVFAAVCAIRRRKLPDPALIGNAGSFFKNPIVPEAQAAFIRDHHADLPVWPADDGRCKLSAAWLIDRCGLKGLREGDAGISERHALVLVNHGQATGRQLWALAQRVRATVAARFGVDLEPEPRIVGAD